jgi:hypothetical protein
MLCIESSFRDIDDQFPLPTSVQPAVGIGLEGPQKPSTSGIFQIWDPSTDSRDCRSVT